MIALLAILVAALLALAAAAAVAGATSGYAWLQVGLVAMPWIVGLAALPAARAFAIALLQASALLYGGVLLYPAFLSIFFFDGSLRSLHALLALGDCVLVFAIATALHTKSAANPPRALAAAWVLPLLAMAIPYGLEQLRARNEGRKVLETLDFKTGDEGKRLVDCVARFSAANAGRYPADARALEQHCGGELRLSYYQVEYVAAPGGADYSMCLTPTPGAVQARGPLILGPWADLMPAHSNATSPCGATSVVSAGAVAAAAHQCLLRRLGASTAAPSFSEIWYGYGCLSLDAAYAVKVSDTQITLPGSGRLLLLPPSEGTQQVRFLHCDPSDAVAPRVWSSRAFFQPAPPELAGLCLKAG